MVVVVGGRASALDEGHRLRELIALETRAKTVERSWARATGLVEQDRADVAELQGGGIQVVERAKSFLLSGESGPGASRSVIIRSSKSRASSNAVASKTRAKASKVATRRSGGIRAIVAAQDEAA